MVINDHYLASTFILIILQSTFPQQEAIYECPYPCLPPPLPQAPPAPIELPPPAPIDQLPPPAPTTTDCPPPPVALPTPPPPSSYYYPPPYLPYYYSPPYLPYYSPPYINPYAPPPPDPILPYFPFYFKSPPPPPYSSATTSLNPMKMLIMGLGLCIAFSSSLVLLGWRLEKMASGEDNSTPLLSTTKPVASTVPYHSVSKGRQMVKWRTTAAGTTLLSAFLHSSQRWRGVLSGRRIYLHAPMSLPHPPPILISAPDLSSPIPIGAILDNFLSQFEFGRVLDLIDLGFEIRAQQRGDKRDSGGDGGLR
ncbi:hypothetical protein Dimus_034081 [Dionaea muscipula]